MTGTDVGHDMKSKIHVVHFLEGLGACNNKINVLNRKVMELGCYGT